MRAFIEGTFGPGAKPRAILPRWDLQAKPDDETGFLVYMSSDGANWNLVGETGTDESYLEMVGLQGGIRYLFKMVASNENGTSLDSNLLSVTTQPPPTRPNAPSGLKAVNATTNSVPLTWQDASDNEALFRIYYSTNRKLDPCRNNRCRSDQFSGQRAERENRLSIQGGRLQ